MIRPANYTLNIIRRSHFDFGVRVRESKDGPAVDLSNLTVLAQMWDRSRTTLYGSFTIDSDLASEGWIILRLTADESISLPNNGAYDVKLIYPDNKEYYILQGTFVVKEGYTDD